MRTKSLQYLLTLFIAVPCFAVSPFELPWMNNTNATSPSIYKSKDHSNGVFVVEAYFLDCPWCNYNAPAVDALASKFKDNPRVQVLDVGIDRNDSQYAEWIRRHHPNHPVLKDSRRRLIGQLGTSGYPSTYVIDCRGNVVEKIVGAWENSDKEALEQAIEKELTKDCQADEAE